MLIGMRSSRYGLSERHLAQHCPFYPSWKEAGFLFAPVQPKLRARLLAIRFRWFAERDVVGALRRLAHHFVDLVSIRPDENAPAIGLDAVEDDRHRETARRAEWELSMSAS
jgi:hypothetical protein